MISPHRAGPALLLLGLLATACAQFTIKAESNPAADFGRYRTFGWLASDAAPPADRDTGDRFIDARLTADIESAMQRKGYLPATAGAPDLLLTYRLVRTDAYDEPALPYGAVWRRSTYEQVLHASADSYDRGTLIVDVIDRAANELVWRGSASARLLPNLSYKQRVARAQAAVDAIFRRFPVR